MPACLRVPSLIPIVMKQKMRGVPSDFITNSTPTVQLPGKSASGTWQSEPTFSSFLYVSQTPGHSFSTSSPFNLPIHQILLVFATASPPRKTNMRTATLSLLAALAAFADLGHAACPVGGDTSILANTGTPIGTTKVLDDSGSKPRRYTFLPSC